MKYETLSPEEQILAQATKRDIQAAGGLEVCAGETGLSTSQLSRCCSPKLRDSITERDITKIEQIGHGKDGHPHVLRARARMLGYLLIEQNVCEDDPDGIMQTGMELATELGDVAKSINDAMRDQDYDPEEAEHTLEQLDEMDAVSARLRLKLKTIASKK